MNVVGLISVHFFSERLKMAENGGGGGLPKTRELKLNFCCRFRFEFLRLMFPFSIADTYTSFNN